MRPALLFLNRSNGVLSIFPGSVPTKIFPGRPQRVIKIVGGAP